MDNILLLPDNTVQLNLNTEAHVPSQIQADTLFTFTINLDYLMQWIEYRIVAARYCIENLEYLKIPNIPQIAFPMKCFCDINLHRLNQHLAYYGFYGIAFSKEWGMKKGIQPIHYINPKSRLREDFTNAFSKAVEKNGSEKPSSLERLLQDTLFHELMYMKPYSGECWNRVKETNEMKSFTDECEWRFVPDIVPIGYEQAITDVDRLANKEMLDEFSNSFRNLSEAGLEYEIGDIKHVIVKSEEDFELFVTRIDQMDTLVQERDRLISKIIVWDESKGDF